MMRVKRFIVNGLELADHIFDQVPTFEDGKYYPYGGWGCRMGLARLSAELDEKWDTGHWRPVDEEG